MEVLQLKEPPEWHDIIANETSRPLQQLEIELCKRYNHLCCYFVSRTFIHLSYLHSKPLSAFKYMYKEKYTDIANLQISVTDLPNNHILADGRRDIAPPNKK